jgi:predicted phosphodiesterase
MKPRLKIESKSLYTHHEDGPKLLPKDDDIAHFIYFTDSHIGVNTPFLSRDGFKEVVKYFDVVSKIITKTKTKTGITDVMHGGDIFDTHHFVQSNAIQGRGVNFEMLRFVWEFFDKHNIKYCKGNHDFEHGPNPEFSIQNSPVYMLSRFSKQSYFSNDLKIFMKHWKPVMDSENWGVPSKTKPIRVLVTHEDLISEKKNFPATKMKTYETRADLVFTADIHDHQGVNAFNGSVFVSPGASNRVNSSEKDKQIYMTNVFIRKDNILEVEFIHLLDKDDNPDLYWVDVRKADRKVDKEKKVTTRSIDFLEEMIQDDESIEQDDLSKIMDEFAKDLGFSEDEREQLPSL